MRGDRSQRTTRQSGAEPTSGVGARARREAEGTAGEDSSRATRWKGIVRTIKDFGAFVDLGGLDGLIHISKLSWDRVKHPSEVFEVGQKVKVKIDTIDKETGKISLSYRDLLENPWDTAEAGIRRRFGP